MIIEIPFDISADTISSLVAQTPNAFFLDSSDGQHSQARYSYAGIFAEKIETGNNNPWPFLESFAQEKKNPGPFPFMGGLVGYLAYETYSFLEDHKTKQNDGPIPLYWFGFYSEILVIDHKSGKKFLITEDSHPKSRLEIWREKIFSHDKESTKKSHQSNPDHSTGLLKPSALALGPRNDKIKLPFSFEDYSQKITHIKNYLKAGDIYQVNLTGRFETNTSLSTETIYKNLRYISPAPYAALLNTKDFQILSASPELLLSFKDGKASTSPIKGTRKRHQQPNADLQAKEELIHSQKDQAELLMIVDLERNDLGKICKPGSVCVESLATVESFAQVHHLVAHVSGHIKEGHNTIHALKALFPGGSVTGAPKIRAMDIIEELEKTPRSVYTGALGFLSNTGEACFNLPIRTLTKVGEKVYFHAGGGIVADSESTAEYEELMVKASGIKQALTLEKDDEASLTS